jgi:hypothetical protein
VAFICCAVPSAIEPFAGVTAIDTRLGAVTVSVAEPLIAPEAAVMVAVPLPTEVAIPLVFTVATDVAVELQVPDVVRFCLLPSVNVPVAVNCWVRPSGIEAEDGVTAIVTSTGLVTAKEAEPVTVPDVAVIVVLPCALLVARPVELIVATDPLDELHAAVVVRSCVVPLL